MKGKRIIHLPKEIVPQVQEKIDECKKVVGEINFLKRKLAIAKDIMWDAIESALPELKPANSTLNTEDMTITIKDEDGKPNPLLDILKSIARDREKSLS